MIENVFSLPGMGKMIVGAVSTRNYPIVQGGVLIITLMFILINLVTDILMPSLILGCVSAATRDRNLQI